MSDDLHIVHIVAPAPYGGLESVVRSLARGQLASGCRVDVVAIHEPLSRPHPFVAALAADGIDARVVTVNGRAYLRERATVQALCRDLKPSIVHTHGYRPDIIDAPAARSTGARTVTTVHGFTGYKLRGQVYERLQLRSFRHFDAIIAVSQPIASVVLRAGIKADRVQVIPNSANDDTPLLSREDARRALGIETDRFVVGWVGRLSPEKGPDVFVAALAELGDNSICACIVGDGPERRRLEAQAKSLGVKSISWRGAVPNMGRLFSAFDLFVLSSRTEGTPIVLIEAVRAGVPIVASRVGGVPDLLRADEAHLVEPLSPSAIVSAVRLVQSNHREALHRAATAASRLGTPSAHSSWVSAYVRVYRALMEH